MPTYDGSYLARTNRRRGINLVNFTTESPNVRLGGPNGPDFETFVARRKGLGLYYRNGVVLADLNPADEPTDEPLVARGTVWPPLPPTPPAGAQWVAYGISNPNGIIYTSEDASGWILNTTTIFNNGSINDIVQNGSTWVASGSAGGNGIIAKATDASGTWTSQSIDDAFQGGNILCISSYGSTWVVGGATNDAGGVIAVSNNNTTTWIPQTTDAFPTEPGGLGGNGSVNDIAYNGSTWVAVGSNGTGLYGTTFGAIATSTDASGWVTRTTDAFLNGNINTIAHNSLIWVAVGYSGTGGAIATSTDAIGWVTQTTDAFVGGRINAIAYNRFLWVAVGYSSSGGAVATSINGTRWTTQNINVFTNINDIAQNSSLFVAVGLNGANGTIATSTNGTTWVVRYTGSSGDNIVDINYNGTVWVAAISAGALGSSVVTSYDGISWETHTLIGYRVGPGVVGVAS